MEAVAAIGTLILVMSIPFRILSVIRKIKMKAETTASCKIFFQGICLDDVIKASFNAFLLLVKFGKIYLIVFLVNYPSLVCILLGILGTLVALITVLLRPHIIIVDDLNTFVGELTSVYIYFELRELCGGRSTIENGIEKSWSTIIAVFVIAGGQIIGKVFSAIFKSFKASN
jgi:hypothetical protein